jgi:hypothetical protein
MTQMDDETWRTMLKDFSLVKNVLQIVNLTMNHTN